MKMLVLFILLPGLVFSRPQSQSECEIFDDCAVKKDVFPNDCNEVFGDCSKVDVVTNVCDDVLDDCESPGSTQQSKCFATNKEIETAVFRGDTRQAFNDCNKTTSCDDYREQDYQCAPYWQCHKNTSTIITDGEGLIDVRNIDPNICLTGSGTLDATDTKCPKDQEVCCKRPDLRRDRCTPTKSPKWSKCGRRNTDDEASVRVTGLSSDGLFAQPGEFPHVCIVYRQNRRLREYKGGASLIAPNKVLTVAHKFYLTRGGANLDERKNPRKYFVRCGEYNVKAQTELLIHQESRVVKLHFEPRYNPYSLTHNMVILMIEENFVYQSHIGPICLPNPEDYFDNDQDCWSSGWGSSDFTSNGLYSDALKKIDMPVVPREECQQRLRTAERPGKSFVLEQSWLCVGGEEGKDTCTGDGGSPHICRNKQGDWTQVGSVAFGFGCGNSIPSIYSSITASVCWIDWVMSCKPLSRYFVDTTEVDDVDIRGSDVDSVNNFTLEQCGDWALRNRNLTNICNVEYISDY